MKTSFFLYIPLAALLLVACDPGNAPKQLADYPEMDSPAYKNYQKQCSVCHMPPRTTTHTAEEWPSVIARMQEHRVQRRIAPMQAADMLMVRDYLVRNAAGAEH